MSSLKRQSPFAIGLGLPDVPRYAAGRALLPPKGHEFVNKIYVYPKRYLKGTAGRSAALDLRRRIPQ
jgi:hypothetical protein